MKYIPILLFISYNLTVSPCKENQQLFAKKETHPNRKLALGQRVTQQQTIKLRKQLLEKIIL